MTDNLKLCQDLVYGYCKDQDDLLSEWNSGNISYSQHIRSINEIFLASSWDEQMEIYHWANHQLRVHLNMILTDEQKTVAALLE